MLEIFDLSRRRVAIAENAHAITEDQQINSIWYLNFSLPYDDPKRKFCNPFWYVRADGGELYRIMPATVHVDETGIVSYQCEHVLATLLDTVLFGYHVVGDLGTYTADCIQYLLSRQSHWVLAECDFRNQFEYGWEQENLLSALFSITAPLENYIWRTDTSVYPWRLSLKRLDMEGIPKHYVRRARNMLSYSAENEPQDICTRLYPLGYGEGVNQLGIADINGGVPYLESPQRYIDRYGLIERIWIDRRYEDAESLMAAAKTRLDQLQEPSVSYEIGFAELDRPAGLGDRIRILHPDGGYTDTYITGIQRDHEEVSNCIVTVSNHSTNIASRIADLADKQRIEQVYAQGATQVYGQSLQANGSPNHGVVMDFIIPSEMRMVNGIRVKIRLNKFRSYAQGTAVNEKTVKSSSTDSETVEVGESGGIRTQTIRTTDDSDPYYTYYQNAPEPQTGGPDHHWLEEIDPYWHKHPLFFNHKHRYIAPWHSHVTERIIHFHSVRRLAHAHTVDIPAHKHEITPGIYQFGYPQSFSISVCGQKKMTVSGTSTELDITKHLLDSGGKIPRDVWLSIEVTPDDLSYISICMSIQGFVQSRGNNTV